MTVPQRFSVTRFEPAHGGIEDWVELTDDGYNDLREVTLNELPVIAGSPALLSWNQYRRLAVFRALHLGDQRTFVVGFSHGLWRGTGWQLFTAIGLELTVDQLRLKHDAASLQAMLDLMLDTARGD